jgi:hypothetical protein
MKKFLSLALLVMLPAAAMAGHPKNILSFETMFGVEGSFLGSKVVRGIEGDRLPWEVKSVVGSLSTKGHLTINVKGLVFPNISSVPAALRGINDEKKFRGVVSCLTDDKSTSRVNVFTKGFKATRSGNSVIDAHVKLPNPCVAPIIFIASGSEDDWFAVTGAERD